MSSTAVDENPLHLTHCMRCGYALETLPPEGICPECGIQYDQGIVVLRGMWSGNGSIGIGSQGAILSQIAVLAFCVFLAGIMHRGGSHFEAIGLLLIVTAWFTLELAFRFSVKRAAIEGALLQCRFNRFGCLQCDIPEETVGIGDYRRIWRWVVFGIAGSVIAGIPLYHWQWSWIAPVLVFLIWEAGAIKGRRRAMKFAQRDTEGQVLMIAARDRGRQVVATPWSAIADIRVGQFRGRPFPANSNRWYLTSIASKGWPKRYQAINCEVEATSTQIRALKVLIAQWQAAAAT